MSQHTPGPWKVGGPNQYLNQVSIEPSIGAAYGAGPELVANARLIAAAPDLLEALNTISNWLVCAPIATPEDMAQAFPQMQAVVDAALAKATGEPA